MNDISKLSQAKQAFEKPGFDLAARVYGEMSADSLPITKETLENLGHPRDNGPVIAGHGWKPWVYALFKLKT